MTRFDAWLALTAWAAFLLIWFPWRLKKFRDRMRMLRAIRKGTNFWAKYTMLKLLTRGTCPTNISNYAAT